MNEQQEGRFEGRVVVITGSATGIGEATMSRFASEGASVAGLDNQTAKNEATAATIRHDGGEAIAIECDVRSEEAQTNAFAKVLDRYGRIDVLVTSAGIYVGSALVDIPMERWHDIESVNLTGVLLSNKLVAATMIEQKSGSIINVASMAAKTSWPYSAEYSATKSGVIGITRSVAMELGPDGITANAVCPGNTVTAMVRTVAAEIGATRDMTGEEWLDMRANDTALKRLAEPWEVAGLIAFLASDDARYITGQSIEIDGGLILS
ncbi:MAG: SDR family oxidoreductase [Actinobacteria bacterium]|nr:SDR family oxidoreductase [Actinomycetota bacterium]